MVRGFLLEDLKFNQTGESLDFPRKEDPTSLHHSNMFPIRIVFCFVLSRLCYSNHTYFCIGLCRIVLRFRHVFSKKFHGHHANLTRISCLTFWFLACTLDVRRLTALTARRARALRYVFWLG
jgi:hypothetical protein